MGAKNKSKGGPKISKIKLKNIKGKKLGTGKKTKSKEIVKARRKLQRNIRKKLANKSDGKSPIEPDAVIEDVLDMIPSEDLSHLRSINFKNKFYLNNPSKVNEKNGSESWRSKKKKSFKSGDDDDLEESYENKHMQAKERMEEESNCLPIKTVKGFHFPIMSSSKDRKNEMEFDLTEMETPQQKKKKNVNNDDVSNEEMMSHEGTEVTTAMLLARRKRKITEYKVRIGILSSSFLEDPENRLQHLDSLLAIMGTSEESVALIVPKLVALSLQAIFKDVLPLYPIKHHNVEGVKLKKDTRQLQSFESGLLKRYKVYMQKLEKMVMRYCPRKSTNTLSEGEGKLGKIALNCMCRMLESHPYFNLSTNILNFIVPLLNNWDAEVREIVTNTIRTIFRIDKRGEISYEAVRRINILVKSKLKPGKIGVLRKDVVDVLLALRIKEADLEKEKEEESSGGKKMTFEQRKMLSKRQRKKAKELVQLEKELLEASAEESKSRKSHFLTEITKLVFTIYFRALKTTPKSNILSSILEGLSKFAHVINIDFFEDLLKVLQGLLRDTNLPERQFLLCISTVLAVLDGQGAALTLDPSAFHKYLYCSMVKLSCGKPQTNVELALRCTRLACSKKRMPAHTAVAFAKRLATMSLQVEHHDALGTLQQLKHVLRLQPSCSVLLDCEGAGASGVYLPELEDPNHSGAQSSTLWEIAPLMSHYHPWVINTATGIVVPEKSEPLPGSLAQLSPEDLTTSLNVNTMEFNPKLNSPNDTTRRNNRNKNRPQLFRPKTEYFIREMEMIDEDMSEDTLVDVDFIKV